MDAAFHYFHRLRVILKQKGWKYTIKYKTGKTCFIKEADPSNIAIVNLF